jgi:hypothetical protein
VLMEQNNPVRDHKNCDECNTYWEGTGECPYCYIIDNENDKQYEILEKLEKGLESISVDLNLLSEDFDQALGFICMLLGEINDDENWSDAIEFLNENGHEYPNEFIKDFYSIE